jgi:hypothetical protein
MQNGLVESLIGRLRDECLNKHLFKSLPAARHTLELWRVDYKTQRPHTCFDGLSPFIFAYRSAMDHNHHRLWLWSRGNRGQAQPAHLAVWRGGALDHVADTRDLAEIGDQRGEWFFRGQLTEQTAQPVEIWH